LAATVDSDGVYHYSMSEPLTFTGSATAGIPEQIQVTINNAFGMRVQ